MNFKDLISRDGADDVSLSRLMVLSMYLMNFVWMLKGLDLTNVMIILIIVSVYFFTSCQTIISDINLSFSKVDISHILLDSTLNIRALEIQDKKVYNATSKGEIYSFDTNKPDLINVDQYSSQIDSVLYPNFRSLSIVNQDVFTITIGNPA
mgnify:CR=1 FL=1